MCSYERGGSCLSSSMCGQGSADEVRVEAGRYRPGGHDKGHLPKGRRTLGRTTFGAGKWTMRDQRREVSL